VVRALNSRLDGRRFNSQLAWQIWYWDGWPSLGGQTTLVFHQATQANSASYHQRDGKRAPAKVQHAVQLGVKDKYGSLHVWINVKLCDPLIACAIPQHLRSAAHDKCYTNRLRLPFTFIMATAGEPQLSSCPLILFLHQLQTRTSSNDWHRFLLIEGPSCHPTIRVKAPSGTILVHQTKSQQIC